MIMLTLEKIPHTHNYLQFEYLEFMQLLRKFPSVHRITEW